MRKSLIDACRELVAAPEYNDFWILSIARDNSFEEGDRSAPQKRLIARYKVAGIPDHLLDQLRLGINGNVASILKRQSPELDQINRNKGEGHDLLIASPHARGGGFVEIKLVYECTLSKYYKEIARDYQIKLAATRKNYPDAELLLVVFFVECPSLDYPAGYWKDRPQGAKARQAYLKNKGIESQLGDVTSAIGQSPSWPSSGAQVCGLHVPVDPEIRRSMVALYEEQFVPVAAWKCEPERLFSTAKIGVALWEYPPCQLGRAPSS